MRTRTIVSPRKWLLLPIETKARELMGKTLLACHAADQGWGVVLGDKRIIRNQQPLLPKGILLEKDADPTHEDLIAVARANGNRLSAMDEEGLVSYSGELYLKSRISKEYFQALDYFFAWGDVQAGWLESVDDSRGTVVRTGNPRFDLLRPEFRSVFHTAADKLKKVYGRIILFNTNFGMANPNTGRDVLAYLRNSGKLPDRDSELFYTNAKSFENKQLQTFLELVPSVADRYTEHTVIVRPHPSESHVPWNEIARNHNNVKVRYEGSATEWISAAEVMVHANCTTGIEAYLLNRPVIAYRVNQDERFDLPITNDLSTQASSADELFSLLDAIVEGRAYGHDDSARKGEVSKRYISGTNGSLAIETIVDHFDRLELPISEAGFPLRPKRPSLLDRMTYRAKRVAKGMLGNRDRSKPAVDPAYGRQKFPGIDMREVQELVGELTRTSGRFDGVKVAEVCRDTCCVYSD